MTFGTLKYLPNGSGSRSRGCQSSNAPHNRLRHGPNTCICQRNYRAAPNSKPALLRLAGSAPSALRSKFVIRRCCSRSSCRSGQALELSGNGNVAIAPSMLSGQGGSHAIDGTTAVVLFRTSSELRWRNSRQPPGTPRPHPIECCSNAKPKRRLECARPVETILKRAVSCRACCCRD